MDQRLAPVLNGVPSALQFTAGASVAPGDYTLKFAAAEGDKAGTVEHTIHAALTEADGVVLSDLTVGGPTDVGEHLRPTIGYTVNFGTVHGYVEAYGDKLEDLTAVFEIAVDAQRACASARVRAQSEGGRRALVVHLSYPDSPAAGRQVRCFVRCSAKVRSR